MASPNTNHWETDPEYIELLNYLIKETENAKSPLSIRQLAREFKEKSGTTQTKECLSGRIPKVRKRIRSFKHIDKNTKVKMLFALSASVNAGFLKELKKDAVVKIDKKGRITYYKANDGSLERRGDHSLSAKITTSNRSLRSMINSYYKDKNDADAFPRNESEKGMRNLIEFVTEKCENVNSPLSILQLIKEFNSRFGKSLSSNSIQVRLRKDALVEVDYMNRITYYKANDGSLELRGDHSRSAKVINAILESKRSLLRVWIIDYFKNKNNADAVPKNEKEKEMGNLIEFITEKCDNVNSPLTMGQLTRDFNKKLEISRTFACTYKRLLTYCRMIQKTEFLDTQTKVKQLFGLSISVDSDCLKELRKNAFVEVDENNRIIKYTSNDNSLSLRGNHNGSKVTKPRQVAKKIEKTVMATADDSEEDSDSEGVHDSSDEYSSEEFDSEFDSDDENGQLDETEDLMEPSDEVDDFDNETPVRNRSPSVVSFDDNFDFDPPTERSHRSEETEMREDEEKENDPEIIKNAGIKTRSGRLSKRRHLDSDFSNNQANSSNSGASISTNSASSRPAKQKKRAIEKKEASSSSNESRSSSRSIRRSSRNSSFPSNSTESEENMDNQEAPEVDGNPSDYHGPRIQEMDDYDYNPRENNHSESTPIDNSLQESQPPAVEEHSVNNETQSADSRSDTVAQEPKPEKESLTLQTNGNEFISMESHIQILESLLHMMDTLDTPTFAEDQMRIEKTVDKYRSIGNEEEKIRLNELRTSLMTCLLIVEKSAKKEIVKGEDTTSLKEFLLIFHNFLVSLKLKELDGFVSRVKYMTKELKVEDKKFPTKKIQFALQSILEIIAP